MISKGLVVKKKYLFPDMFSLFLVFFFASVSGSSMPSSQVDLVLTTQKNGNHSETKFSCNSLIHGYLTFDQPLTGEHLLEGIWISPDGAVLEHAKIPLNYDSPGQRTAQMWLKLKEGEKDPRDFFHWEESNSEENHPHHGSWQLNVLMDGQHLVKTNFQVQCL